MSVYFPPTGSAPLDIMDLNSLIYSTLQITVTDGRAFIGHFVCTDHDQNIILAQAEELLPKHLLDDPEQRPISVGAWGGREMGLVMIKGKDIVKIEAQMPTDVREERDNVT